MHARTHTRVVRFSSRERAKNLPLPNKESELVFAIRYDFSSSAFASWLFSCGDIAETASSLVCFWFLWNQNFDYHRASERERPENRSFEFVSLCLVKPIERRTDYGLQENIKKGFRVSISRRRWWRLSLAERKRLLLPTSRVEKDEAKQPENRSFEFVFQCVGLNWCTITSKISKYSGSKGDNRRNNLSNLRWQLWLEATHGRAKLSWLAAIFLSKSSSCSLLLEKLLQNYCKHSDGRKKVWTRNNP